MKITRSSNETPLQDLPKGKVSLRVHGQDREGIWVAIDETAKKMYLLNNAVAFFPMMSWGSEWDLGDTVDVGKARGETPEDTVLVFHKEMYDNLTEFMEGEEFIFEKYLEKQIERETAALAERVDKLENDQNTVEPEA